MTTLSSSREPARVPGPLRLSRPLSAAVRRCAFVVWCLLFALLAFEANRIATATQQAANGSVASADRTVPFSAGDRTEKTKAVIGRIPIEERLPHLGGADPVAFVSAGFLIPAGIPLGSSTFANVSRPTQPVRCRRARAPPATA